MMTNRAIKRIAVPLACAFFLLLFLLGCASQEKLDINEALLPIAEKSGKSVEDLYLDRAQKNATLFFEHFSDTAKALDSADSGNALNEAGNLVLALSEGRSPLMASGMKFAGIEEIEPVENDESTWYKTYTIKATFSYGDDGQTLFSYIVKDSSCGLVSVVACQ